MVVYIISNKKIEERKLSELLPTHCAFEVLIQGEPTDVP
jgi:hypothetical protein